MPDRLPFVIAPVGDAAAAAVAAAEAATLWGMPPPQMLRMGMNALFAAGDEVVLRVSRPTAPPEQAVWLAQELARLGVRVARQLRASPLQVGGLVVFAVERLHSAGEIDWAALGEMVRRLHAWSAAEVSGHHPLPRCDDFPWWDTTAALAEVDELLDEPARRGLMTAIEVHGGWRRRVSSRVVCHGDVHPGNVVQTDCGPALLDWDLLCHGPAAWDHASVMTWPRRWAGEATMYERFAEGYGLSLAGDPLAESLATMRNVVATLMRVRAARHDLAATYEAERRLRYWRGDPLAPQWTAQ
jgi:hypothetical protein